jgi:hypothetical protein
MLQILAAGLALGNLKFLQIAQPCGMYEIISGLLKN